MYVPYGLPFTATLVDPGGLTDVNLGARIEVPVTRAIVGSWQAATLSGYVWSVTLDAPPATPQSQAIGLGANPFYATELATGEFNLVWLDDLDPPTFEAFVPLFVSDDGSGIGVGGNGPPAQWPTPDPADVTPTIADVAALERTRMVDDGGTDQATFGPNTRPTDVEVQALIDDSVPVILTQLRPTFPASFNDQVANAVALYAAILVEGSYYREQINSGSVALYRALYEEQIKALQSSIELLVGASQGRLA